MNSSASFTSVPPVPRVSTSPGGSPLSMSPQLGVSRRTRAASDALEVSHQRKRRSIALGAHNLQRRRHPPRLRGLVSVGVLFSILHGLVLLVSVLFNEEWRAYGDDHSDRKRAKAIRRYSSRPRALYDGPQKSLPYIGRCSNENIGPNSPNYRNCVGVFPDPQPHRLHGLIGINPNGSPWFPRGAKPSQNLSPSEMENRLNNGGGFYLELSDSISLDRRASDGRSTKCKTVTFDTSNLPDASIIITFHNEPLSTLMRSVHSVLNLTPPELLREIILVDDNSPMYEANQNTTESHLTQWVIGKGKDAKYVDPLMLEKATALLPKTRLLRLTHRHGIVKARLAAAEQARGQVLVVLDSHIEVNNGWLEPLVSRVNESRHSIVMPQIGSIDSHNFSFHRKEGIGCKISWSWGMSEKSSAPGRLLDVHPIASPSMAGGIFAVDRAWFWELGGYDSEFLLWGAENLEMSFRAWMCGGRIDCMPCSIVYHVFRKSGLGYTHSLNAITRNRLRVAQVWMGDYASIANLFLKNAVNKVDDKSYIGTDGKIDTGSIEQMTSLKEQLQCKDFNWFLHNVDNSNPITSLEEVLFAGAVISKAEPTLCLDTMQNTEAGHKMGLFHCHGSLGTQGFISSKKDGLLRLMSDERVCLGAHARLIKCAWPVEKDPEAPLPRPLPPVPPFLPARPWYKPWGETSLEGLYFFQDGKIGIGVPHTDQDICLTLVREPDGKSTLEVLPCDGRLEQQWRYEDELHAGLQQPSTEVKF